MAYATFNSLLNNNRLYTFKGGLSPTQDGCVVISLSTADSKGTYSDVVSGLVAQQVQATASRQPQLVWEIGTGNYYILDARPQGTGTIIRFVGLGSEGTTAIVNFANICRPTKLSMGVKSCTCPNQAAAELYSFTGGFLTSLQMSAQQGQDYITGQLGFMFVGLEQGTGDEGGQANQAPVNNNNNNNNNNQAPVNDQGPDADGVPPTQSDDVPA